MRNNRVNLVISLILELVKLVGIIIVHIIANSDNQLAFELRLKVRKVCSCSILCSAVISFEVHLLLTLVKPIF